MANQIDFAGDRAKFTITKTDRRDRDLYCLKINTPTDTGWTSSFHHLSLVDLYALNLALGAVPKLEQGE